MRNGLLLAAAGLALAAPAAHAAPAAFAPAPPIATGWQPAAAVADLDGDGRDDIVVGSGSDLQAGVTILRSTADGGRVAVGPYAVMARPERIQVADLNGDGRLDIVAAGSWSLAILHARADGGYDVVVDGRSLSGDVGIADFNSDGRLELAYASGDLYTVTVGSWTGGEYRFDRHAVGHLAENVEVSDRTGDGIADILAIRRGTGNSTLVAGGRAGLEAPVVVNTPGFEGRRPLGRDLDGDGAPDVAVIDADRWHVDVRRSGEADFRRYALTGQARGLVADDFTGDGLTDLATLTTATGSAVRLTVLPALPGGTFGTPVDHPLGGDAQDVAFASGDLDDDGRPDVIVREATETFSLRVWHNRTPRLALGTPSLAGGGLQVPYTLAAFRDGVAELRVEVQRPGAPGFTPHAVLAPQAAGSVEVIDPALRAGGEWRVRVTAYDDAGHPLETTEAVRDLEGEAGFGLHVPSFGQTAVGVTAPVERVRIENSGPAKLRARRIAVTVRADEYRIVEEDCSARAVPPGESCHVAIAFTPSGPGPRNGWIEVDGQSSSAGSQLDGYGAEPARPAEPQPAVTARPKPAPLPAPPAPDPPELVFDSAPGRTTTRLFRLRLEQVRLGTTVTVRCAKGCPRKSFTKRDAYWTVSLSRFASRPLKVGTTIRVRLAAPGARPVEITLKVRARREPRVTTRALAARSR